VPNVLPKTKNKTPGFTLIELLVVITVIGALSGILLGVINSGGIRAKARDSQRKSDIKKIQTALELYFADYRSYPVSGALADDSWEQGVAGSQLVTALQPNYIDPVPVDPQEEVGGDADPCANPEFQRYNYRSLNSGASYYLSTIVEITSSADDSPCPEIANFCGNGFATLSVCYFAQSP